MKNLKNLGKALSKKEQLAISGGMMASGCSDDLKYCLAGCQVPFFGYMGGILNGGCLAICKGKEIICKAKEAVDSIDRD